MEKQALKAFEKMQKENTSCECCGNSGDWAAYREKCSGKKA